MNPRILSQLFALLIFVAHLNCVLGHQLLSVSTNGGLISSLDSGEIPTPAPVDSKSCEHGGCICDGATLAVEFEFLNPAERLLAFDFLNSDCFASIAQDVKNIAFKRLENPICDLPLRASERCAVLQTFLI